MKISREGERKGRVRELDSILARRVASPNGRHTLSNGGWNASAEKRALFKVYFAKPLNSVVCFTDDGVNVAAAVTVYGWNFSDLCRSFESSSAENEGCERGEGFFVSSFVRYLITIRVTPRFKLTILH